jgi:arylsulfatase A-like enzyme
MAGGPSRAGSTTADISTHSERGVGTLLLLLVAVAGMAGSVGEAAIILGARAVLHRFTLFNPQGIWLSAIATALLAAIPLAIAWVIGSRRRRDAGLAAATGVAVALAALQPLLVLKDRLHPLALLALAIGLGVQAARMALARPALLPAVIRGSAIALAVVVVAGAAWFNVGRALRERAAIAALPDGAPGRPNVILLVLDTMRALSMSAYGHDRPTSPFLMELAARGARFDRALSTSPWTLPSHSTMFTGRYPHELSSAWSVPLDGTFPTLAERLRDAGYVTAGVAANLRYCSYEFGVSRGFDRYRDYDVSVSEMWRSSAITRELIMAVSRRVNAEPGLGRQWAPRINERFLDFVDDRPQDKPFFAFLNYYDAHGPYAPPAPYDTMFLGRRPSVVDPGRSSYTPAEIEDLRAAYDASIAYLDAQLRVLFGELARRGLLENTVVILTSDHGEEFNEHGVMNHGSSLYFPSVHVPLFVVWPGRIAAGTVVTEPVTLRDLSATVLDLVGGSPSGTLPGTSLATHWRGAPSLADSSLRIAEVDFAQNLPAGTPVTHGNMKSLALRGIRYIRRGDGHEELFDISADPWESTNLVGDSAHQGALFQLRDLVSRLPSGGSATLPVAAAGVSGGAESRRSPATPASPH